MLIDIHPQTPSERDITRVVEALQRGAVIIYPTDTVYALGCDIFQPRAIERICKIRDIAPQKAKFSIVCHDMSNISEYAKVSNDTFKLMRKNLPGAFTFILNGNSNLPKLFKNRRTIGIRVPDNNIARSIVERLGHPLLSASLRQTDDEEEYITDPELINEKYGNAVDLVVGGGIGTTVPSTVVDCTNDTAEIVRQGAAELME